MPIEVTWDQAVEATKRALACEADVTYAQVLQHAQEVAGTQVALRGGMSEDLVEDAMHYLVHRGVARLVGLRPVQIRLTELGRRGLGTVEWLSADRYVGDVAKVAGGTLDPIIVTYLREAKRAHEEGLDLSCAVTLGCASEKAVLLLAEAACPHLGSDGLTKMVKASRVEVGVLFRTLSPRLQQYRAEQGLAKVSPWDELEGLAALFYEFRRHRNDSGHPTGRSPDHTDLTAYLASFRSYARILAGLLAYFKALTPPAAA
jgi:hypothetical protein